VAVVIYPFNLLSSFVECILRAFNDRCQVKYTNSCQFKTETETEPKSKFQTDDDDDDRSVQIKKKNEKNEK